MQSVGAFPRKSWKERDFSLLSLYPRVPVCSRLCSRSTSSNSSNAGAFALAVGVLEYVTRMRNWPGWGRSGVCAPPPPSFPLGWGKRRTECWLEPVVLLLQFQFQRQKRSHHHLFFALAAAKWHCPLAAARAKMTATDRRLGRPLPVVWSTKIVEFRRGARERRREGEEWRPLRTIPIPMVTMQQVNSIQILENYSV